MLEIIAILAVILAIAVAVVLTLALTKPNALRVQRSIGIAAPADRIFHTHSPVLRHVFSQRLFTIDSDRVRSRPPE